MADTALQTAARYFDKELIEPLRQQLIGRKLVNVNPNIKGAGIHSADIMKVIEMGAGFITYELPSGDISRDMIRVDSSVVKIPVLWKGYEVPRDSWDAMKNRNVALDTAAMLSAAQMVGVDEDQLVIDGWKPDGTNYVITGLYQSANNDYSTGKDFGTYGYATDAVAGAMALLEADYVYPPYNLVLNAVQMNELRASRSANGVREMPEILELLNDGVGPGKIFSTPAIADTTGLVIPVDAARAYLELIVPRDMQNTLGEDSKIPDISPIYGTTFELVYPHIKQTNALCKLSSI